MKLADVVKDLAQEGITRQMVEERAISLLENEGFDTLVEMMWECSVLIYGLAVMEDMRSDFVDEVIPQ